MTSPTVLAAAWINQRLSERESSGPVHLIQPARRTRLRIQAGFLLIARQRLPHTTLQTTQEQMDCFVSQLPFKCYLPEITSVGY